MKFVHTKISTSSKVPTLSDVLKAAQTKAAMVAEPTTKVASAIAPSKEAKGNIANFGDKKAKPFGKKDKNNEVEIEVEAEVILPTKKAEAEEGESSGQPEAEAKLVNEPKKPEGDKAKGGGKSKSDGEGESSGQLDVEPLHQEGESTGSKPGSLDTQKSSNKKYVWMKIANLTPEHEAKVREELLKFWPKKFVDALLVKR